MMEKNENGACVSTHAKLEKTTCVPTHASDFVKWLLRQAHRRSPTGRMARVAIKGRDVYGFKLLTESDLLVILGEAHFAVGHVDKYVNRAKAYYKRSVKKIEDDEFLLMTTGQKKDRYLNMRIAGVLMDELKLAANIKGVRYQTLIHEVLTDYVKNLRADV